MSGFVNAYERKTFIIGLSSALNSPYMPQGMMPHMLKIIQEVIRMLGKLKLQEAKALKKAAKKEIDQNAEEDEEDDDEGYGDESEGGEYDEAGEEEDEEELNEDAMQDTSHHHKEETKANKNMGKARMVHHHDDDSQDEEDNGGLGFVNNDEESKGELDSDDDEDEEVDEDFDLHVTMDMLNAPFKKTDEFNFFNQQFRALHDRDSTYINNLVQQMEEEEKKFLRELFETKRVKIEHMGVEADVVRRIITVKRRGGVGSGAPNK